MWQPVRERGDDGFAQTPTRASRAIVKGYAVQRLDVPANDDRLPPEIIRLSGLARKDIAAVIHALVPFAHPLEPMRFDLRRRTAILRCNPASGR